MTNIVKATGVAYRYPQNNRGLVPFSLALQPGEKVLISGPSGCGKSTLARCLTGLIPHLYHGTLEGEVWLDGLRTTDVALWQLAERAGLVFQNPAAQMLASSVENEIIFGLENLGLPRDTISQRLEDTLTAFDLETMRKRAPQTLSGGEQQKLALASIMARRPPVLILDEPLSMLDGTAATELVDHLAGGAAAGNTVVVCEHRHEYLAPIPGLRNLVLDGPGIDGREIPEFTFRPRDAVPTLKVKDLQVTIGGHTILRGLDFGLDAGQVVAIVGRNGAGKTTLLRALAGLQSYEGSIGLNGGQPDLGLIFQNADLQLFNASVREEILYRVPEPDMDLYAWLLEALGLARYEETPPLLLSEGEKKRLALATVLMRQPRHGVLLDEPALGQDAAHKAELIRVAQALARSGQLVILTTHDLTLAAQADRLMLLGPGEFVASGPPAEILDDPAPWAELGLTVPDWVKPGYPGRVAGRTP